MIPIRRAILADSSALNSLVQGSTAYEGIYRSILDGYRISDVQIARDQIFVAELNSQIVGFYSLVVAQGESELDLLFVSEAAQGRGVGSDLMAHLNAVAASREIETIRIVSHPPSLGFYLKMGARLEGVVPPRGQVTWERPLLKLQVRAT